MKEYFSGKEIQFIIENYDVLSKEEIAKHLTRSVSSIVKKAQELRKKGIQLSNCKIAQDKQHKPKTKFEQVNLWPP